MRQREYVSKRSIALAVLGSCIFLGGGSCSSVKQHLEPPAAVADLLTEVDPSLQFTAHAPSKADIANTHAHTDLLGDLEAQDSPQFQSGMQQVYTDLNSHKLEIDLTKSPRIMGYFKRLTAILNSNGALLTDDLVMSDQGARAAVPDFLSRLAISRLNAGDSVDFEAKILLQNQWSARLRAARPGQATFQYSLQLLRDADGAVQAACRTNNLDETTAKYLLGKLGDLSVLIADYKETIKRDMRDRLLTTVATFDVEKLRNGSKVKARSAAMVAVSTHPYPLNRKKTAKLFSDVVGQVFQNLGKELPESESTISPAFAIDWEPSFRAHGFEPPAEDDVDISAGRLSKDHIQRQSDTLKAVDNPFGRWLALRYSRNLDRTDNLLWYEANRDVTRLLLAMRIYRIHHAGQNPSKLDDLVSERTIAAIPVSPFDGSKFVLSANHRSLECNRPFPRLYGRTSAPDDEKTLSWPLSPRLAETGSPGRLPVPGRRGTMVAPAK